MSRHLTVPAMVPAMVLGTVLLAGCALQTPRWIERVVREDPPDEVAAVTDLFDYAQWLRLLDSARRVEEYRELDHSLSDCRDRLHCLKLALLLSGAEPDLTDYERAGDLLERSLETDPGPLMSGYIREQLADLEGIRRRRAEHRAVELELRQEAQAQRDELRRLQESLQAQEAASDALTLKVKALETQIEALTSIEQSLKNRGQSE